MSDMSRFDTREARETLAAFRSGRAELVPEWRPDKLRGGCQPFGTNKCVINLAYAKPGTDAVRVAMHEFAHVKQQLTPCRYAWNKWYYEYMAERFAQRGIRGGMKHLQLVERVERGYPKGWWPDGWDPRRGFVY